MPAFKSYLVNCFWLLIPLFLWNLVFANQLPDFYRDEAVWGNIPPTLEILEHVLRGMVFLLPLIMAFSLKSLIQKVGLGVFILGTLIYFASWIMQIGFPEGNWSQSLIGLAAPAFSTIVWLLGIALIGQKSTLPIPRISWLYGGSAIAFVIIHTAHSVLAYKNL